MKKLYTLFFFLFCFCLISFSQGNNVIEPELQQLIDCGSKEKLAVIIVMRSQAEPATLKAKAAAHRDRTVKRSAVVGELKAHSNRTQTSLLSFLQAEEEKGNVANISSLWISNSITCNATSDVIYALSRRFDVAFVGMDKEVQMFCNSFQENVAQQFTSSVRAGLTPHVIQVGASQVWEQGYTGKNVVVAILDSGINNEHCDLKDHLWQGYVDTDGDGEGDTLVNGWNYVDDNANIKDDYGHGTHCAGIICGDGTSGNITGVAPDATLMTLKIVNRAGAGTPTQMIKGVQFAIENGASILSISSGFKSTQIDASTKESLRRTFVAVLEAGVIAFVAAGNDGDSYGAPDNVDFPAACPPPYLHPDQQTNAGGLSSVVCVGSVNANDEYMSSSSKGPVTWKGTEWNDYPYDAERIGLIRPDICAPGDLIYSLKHDENDKYKFMSGTSQATPCVAGVAALMLEKNSSLTPADICRLMENTAKKLTETKSNLTGSGRVDALNVVDAVKAANEKPFVRVNSFAPEVLVQGNAKELSLFVTNSGKSKSGDNTIVKLSVADKYITISENSKNIGSVAVGSSKEVVFAIDVDPATPNGHKVYMTVVTTDGIYSWSDEIMLEVNSCARIASEISGISTIDAGKETTINVKVMNSGTIATVADTRLTLEANSSYVTFVKNEAVVGTLAVGESVVVPFTFTVSEEIADNSSVRFDLYAIPNSYTDVKDLIYEFEVGTDRYGYLEDGFNGWTTFDASNDGRDHPWWHSSKSMAHKVENKGESVSGKGHLMSETYCQASMQEYTVPIDNYLVSPKVRATANSEIRFKARVHTNYFGEHFGVAVSENGNKDSKSFVTIKEWTINSEDGSGWIEYAVDLSEYNGKDIYVAIRHFFTQQQWQESDNGYDFYVLNVDDVELNNVVDVSETFKNDNYSSFTLKVNSKPLPAPSNLVAKAVDKNTVSLSWDAVKNAQWYSIYRNGAWIKNVTDATTCTDSGLQPNTTYLYKVAAYANEKEYEHSKEVTVTTLQEEYVVSIKSVTPDTLKIGTNYLSITMINDGKYEQESRSTVTLSTENPYVKVVSSGIGINALYPDQETTKDFEIEVDKTIPFGTEVEFNLNIAQKFTPFREWNHTFVIKYGVEIEVKELFSTLYAPMAIKIPAGIEAYVVTAAKNGYAILEQVLNVIPANTAVVLKGGSIEVSTENTYIGDVDPIYNNLLKGTDCETWIEEPAYILSVVDGEYGFYKAKMTDGKFLSKSNKAYLPVSALLQEGQSANLRFVYIDTTDIEILDAEKNDADAEIYDLAGRRVYNPAKGIYIVNGKKVYVK